MFKNCGAVSVFDFDDAMRNRIRGEPYRLIREEEAPQEVVDLGRLVSPPPLVEGLGPIIGSSPGGPDKADVIVVGICQGRARPTDKRCWLDMGPTVEAVCIIDFAYRLSRKAACPLEIWIPDQEYAYSVVDSRLQSDPTTELKVGASLETWCWSRYPDALVRRTSDLAVRADLYSLIADPRLARLYPTGVPSPYNSTGRVFWQELQFLATIAVFLRAVLREGKRVWAVADHEQLRPMAGAWCLVRERVKIISLWPCPRIRWQPPSLRNSDSTRYAERFLTRLKEGNRRMFRGAGPEDMLFATMNHDEIARHLTFKTDEPICEDTLRELLRYLGEDVDTSQLRTLDDAVELLHAGLVRLQKAHPSGGPL